MLLSLIFVYLELRQIVYQDNLEEPLLTRLRQGKSGPSLLTSALSRSM